MRYILHAEMNEDFICAWVLVWREQLVEVIKNTQITSIKFIQQDIRYEVFNCNSEIRKLMVEKWNSSAYIRPMPKKNDSFNSPYHSPIELLSGIFKVLSRIFNRKELNSITS